MARYLANSSIPENPSIPFSIAFRIVPIAPIDGKCGGTKNSSSFSSSISLNALLTPRFAATPPRNATGFTKSLPLPMLLLKFLATAKQSPAMMS